MDRQFSFLVVDADEGFRELCARFLGSLGHKAVSARDGHEALSMLRREWYDVALVDLRLPKLDGLQLVKIIKAEKPSPEVVVLAGYASISSAVEAMKLGAYDYVTKPFQLHEMEMVINRLLRIKKLESENRMLKKRLEEVYRMDQAGPVGRAEQVRGAIVGTSPKMRETFAVIAAASQKNVPVFVTGERGAGKELVARAIHFQGSNHDKPFVAVNCADLSKSLLASVLFGHVKSATAGATMSTPGAFRQAEGGTLFLDEITGADFEVQEKIARALRDREIVPVGAGLPVTVNTRVVVASTVSLAEAVNEGTLSEELAGLLGETVIELPPLRDRREDVPHLVRHFVKKYAREFDAPEKEVLPDAMQLLLAYDWPGNVEELENAIEQAFKRGDAATIGAGDLPQAIRGRQTVQWTLAGKPVPSFEEAERSLIEVALAAARGKKAVAARYLQIDRQRLYRKIRKYHLDPNLGRK